MRKPFNLWGAEEADEEQEPTGTASEADSESDDGGDDDSLDPEAIAARAARRAERKARRDQAAKLGFDSISEMEAFIQTQREQQEQQRSEEEQRLAAIEEREAELQRQAQELQRQNRDLNVRNALTSADLNPERMRQAQVLVNAEIRDADLEVEDEAEVIADAIAALKKGTPEWFTKKVTGTNDAADDGNPPSGSQNDQDDFIAKQRKDFESRGLVFD